MIAAEFSPSPPHPKLSQGPLCKQLCESHKGRLAKLRSRLVQLRRRGSKHDTLLLSNALAGFSLCWQLAPVSATRLTLVA